MKQPNRNTKLLPMLGHPWKCRRYQQMKLSSHNSLRGMDLSELGAPLNLSNSPPGKSIKEHRKWICSRHQILLIRIFWNGLENCGEPTRLGGGAKNEHWTQKNSFSNGTNEHKSHRKQLVKRVKFKGPVHSNNHKTHTWCHPTDKGGSFFLSRHLDMQGCKPIQTTYLERNI